MNNVLKIFTVVIIRTEEEDTWAFQPIGAPFPPNPVKCTREQNMYVALWYKHGKPIHGRAWNNGGVVESSFPYKNSELNTKKQLEGQIQVLQYTGDHTTQGYWYEWIAYKDRFAKADGRQMVRCGESWPIFWNRKEGNLLGYVDQKTEAAHFSFEGKVITKSGEREIGDMMIITRNLIGGPPFCECAHSPKPPPPPPIPPPGPPPPRVMLNEWMDIRTGDAWPTRPLVKALDKSLDTLPGLPPDQYIGLWYMTEEPVMSRVWNEGGKVAANFSWSGKEYTGNVGSIQLLVLLSEHVRGFDYGWIPFVQAASFDKDKEWIPVHINNSKTDISAAVITAEGKQVLGKVDIRNEKSGFGNGGKENAFQGPACANKCVVLCRKAKKGYKFD